MKTIKLFLIFVIFLFSGAIFGLYFWDLNKNGNLSTQTESDQGKVAGVNTSNDDYLIDLAKSLTDKGAVLYCSFLSDDCLAQKKLFAETVKYINYVECDATGSNNDADGCVGQGINSYPTWIYNEQKYVGIQSLSDLAKIINFSR